MEYPPFHLSITTSRWLKVYRYLLLLAVTLAVFSLPKDLNLAMAICGLVIIGCLLRSHQHHARRVRALRLVNFSWLLTTEDEVVPVCLRSSTVWSWLVVMNFQALTSRRRYSLLLLPGCCNSNDFRQLRVVLRHWPVYS